MTGLPAFVLLAPARCRRRRHSHNASVRSGAATCSAPGRASSGPPGPPPSYAAIDAAPANRFFMRRFRGALLAELGVEDGPGAGTAAAAAGAGFDGIVALVRLLSERARGRPAALQEAALRVLRSLFPPWLLGAYRAIFRGLLAAFAVRMNAAVTAAASKWLMGENHLEDGGRTVVVERCRYLEGVECLSVCVNSCKVPTERFFAEHMGVPLYMEPNYEDYSCRFEFGRKPPPPQEDPAFTSPCLSRCPTRSQREEDRLVVCPTAQVTARDT